MKKLVLVLLLLCTLCVSVSHASAQATYGQATSRGRRYYQEDRVLAIPSIGAESTPVGLFGVFDGHIGSQASQFLFDEFGAEVSHGLLPALERGADEAEAFTETLKQAIKNLNEQFLRRAREQHIPAGSTACVALVSDSHVVVANVGDSRAVACLGERVVPLTSDHHPDLVEEKSRIEAAGGIIRNGVINGHFPMSRAIGDLPMTKVGVIATPDTSVWKNDEEGYLVIASDGIYEGLDAQQICEVTRQGGQKSPQALADTILNKASVSSTDNLSVLVIPLNRKSRPLEEVKEEL